MRRVALYGAGRMGRGLAHVFAWAGWDVCLIDAKDRAEQDGQAVLSAARDEVAGSLALMGGFGGVDTTVMATIAGRVRYIPRAGLADALSSADLIMEGVPETLPAKE